jgi:hypothetical protein
MATAAGLSEGQSYSNEIVAQTLADLQYRG